MGSAHQFLIPLIVAGVVGAGRVDGQAVSPDARGLSAPLPAASRPAIRVADSVEAAHELGRIAALESQGRYVQAGRQYDRLLADHGADIVRITDGSFASVTQVVLERLAGWPADARNLYRELIEPRAAAELNTAGQSADPTRWLEAMRPWWLTESAGELALRCARRLAEDGCVESAGWVLERLRQAHPELDQQIAECKRPLVSGAREGGATTQALPAAPDSSFESKSPFWTCDLGAPADRDRENVPATTIGEPSVHPTTLESHRPDAGATRVLGCTISRPTAWNDRIVLQDGSRLWCIRLYSGYVEWMIGSDVAASGGEPDNGTALRMHPESLESHRRGAGATRLSGCNLMRPSTPAVGQDRVFAVLAKRGQEGELRQGAATVEAVLASVDLAGGGRGWEKSAVEILGRPGGAVAFLRSDPLWYERGLYVVVGERAASIEDVYLVRLEPAGGQTVWRRHLASAAAETWDRDGDSSYTLSYRGGQIDVRFAARGGAREGAEALLQARVAALTGEVERLVLAEPLVVATAAASQPRAEPDRWAIDAGGVIVQVEGRRVRAVLRDADPMATLARRIREKPDDSGRYLDLARWAIGQDRDGPRAVKAMEEALLFGSRLNGTTGTTQAAPASRPWIAVPQGQRSDVREQVFELCLDHADRSTITNDLLAMAKRVAVSPWEQVRFRLRFGEALRKQGRGPEAIGLWQEIIDNDSLRDWPVEDTPAGGLADRAIGQVIHEAGREVYGAVEARAAAVLDEAIRTGEAPALERVARTYPNSGAAVKAWLALASRERSAGRPGRAVRRLLEAEKRCGAAERRDVIAGLAACCFEMGDAGEGLRWLARGASEFPEGAVVFAGRPTTFKEAYQAWLAYGRTVFRPLPGIWPPLKPSFEREFKGSWTLLTPPACGGRPICGRYDLALVQAGDALLGIDPATGHDRWRAAWNAEQAPVWLAQDDELVIVSTPRRVLGLDIDSGRERWRWEISRQDVNEALIDPEILDVVTARAFSQTLMALACRSGWVLAIQIESGRCVWRRQVGGGVVGLMAVDDERVVCIRAPAGRPEGVVLDAATGAETRRFPIGLSGQPADMNMMPDGSLAICGTKEVVVYEPATFSPRWRWSPPGGSILGMQAGIGELYLYGADLAAAVSLSDGKPRWQKEPIGDRSAPLRRLWAAGGEVYVAGDRAVAAMAADSGERQWVGELAGGETIERADLVPRYVMAVVSRPAAGGLAGARQIDVVFWPRSAVRGGGTPAPTRYRLVDAVAMQKIVVRDRAVLVQAGQKLVGWACEGPATAASR